MLRQFAPLGLANVAGLLERTPAAVEAKARELSISLRVSSEDVALDGADRLLIEMVRQNPFLAICPTCGQRLARMASGMCRVCHLDALIEIREVEVLEQARERKLAALRQAKRRARICDGCGKAYSPRRESTSSLCAECSAVNHGRR